MKTFGRFDRALARVSLMLAFLIAYGKMLSDFAEFYITGHTANFFWVFGDIFYNPQNPPNNPGPYSLVGLTMLAVLGWANLHLWVREATWSYNMIEPYAVRANDKLSAYIVSRLVKASFGKGRKALLATRILLALRKMGRALAEEKQLARQKKVSRLENALADAVDALEQARMEAGEGLYSTDKPDSIVGDSK